MSIHTGSCRCGGVAIEASGDQFFSGYCHCDDCRRSNGAPVVAFVGYERKQVEWAKDASRAQWLNGGFARHFCNACGAPVAYSDDKVPEVMFFYTGFMDNPAVHPPEHHSYHSEKISWFSLKDDLPKFENTSYPRPE